MKASRFFIGTLKEAPADAEIVSHKLMVRAGMIRRIAGGIYNYLPVGLRSIRKVEAIVREEMNRAGAIELLMPVVQPAELWQESGRWEKYGPELLRFKDRRQGDFVLGPTHEEVVTDIARNQIKSYRQMPVNFYQIQAKFRDEIRPRFGVMRGREFIMKDAYSFDKDMDGLRETYRKMYDAYVRIFTRLGLEFRAVAADNGSIGGSGSHEFHVIADTGEDAIAYCPTSEFAANVEAAEALSLIATRAAPTEPMQKTATPGKAKCEAVAELLNIPLERTIKSIVLATEQEGAEPTIWLLMLRGDHDLNEIKASKLPGLADFRFATEEEIVATFGTPPGYLGPIGTKKPVKVVADSTVANMSDFVVGANEVDFHIAGVNWGRDLPEPVVADIRNVKKGDPSPDGKGVLDICRGIEVGHVFQLGSKYSEAMNATFLDESGKPQPMVMGCYGIGVTRILGAAIEQNFDEKGIIWPESIAPFEIVLCPMGYDRSDAVREHTDTLYAALVEAGIDVILDDRGERPGVMFADWELIGVPHRLVIGERGLKEGKIEYQGRRDTEATLLPVESAAQTVVEKIRAALAR
ncbi:MULTISPECIES: proline--tRNA ligase [Paraburkholderia]|uniref:Proline--tRNA ligase n=1 Tax=Paraburkholderia megapolitana TaxID=420953 RepID=A0A1I3I3K4_9BURK|nr:MULTISPECIES: proline--tRNA ligase [Paraburkholderia]MCX4165585.1 proline--tRNA ligase [Paraburkholderia megapolitana]MDN7161076.1 proline--tRNA ligase [Paraburkholderia sp. CHISQ3]MDQ6498123.1 proline--tRNA ligase [Paraburkholderia megapolitana]QDQ85393.1 proline--tRNA ligase [Paraburkholderia megapolitana]SFI42417.1 prolyl-tRNA synthetase [Paraburkholderia megapolitana]